MPDLDEQPVVPPYHEHWYEVLHGPTDILRQGDILMDLAVHWLADDFDEALATAQALPLRSLVAPWIVASASCDLDHPSGDSPHALVAALKPVTKEVMRMPKKSDFLAACEVLRRNRYPGAFLISDHPDTGFGFHFADFQTFVSLPIAYLRRMAMDRTPRLRLKSPFREDFAAAAGSHLARVGPEVSQQIPRFTKTLFPTKIQRAVESRLPPEVEE